MKQGPSVLDGYAFLNKRFIPNYKVIPIAAAELASGWGHIKLMRNHRAVKIPFGKCIENLHANCLSIGIDFVPHAMPHICLGCWQLHVKRTGTRTFSRLPGSWAPQAVPESEPDPVASQIEWAPVVAQAQAWGNKQLKQQGLYVHNNDRRSKSAWGRSVVRRRVCDGGRAHAVSFA